MYENQGVKNFTHRIPKKFTVVRKIFERTFFSFPFYKGFRVLFEIIQGFRVNNIKKRINVYRDKDYKDIIKQYEKDSIEYLRIYDSKLTIKIIKSVMVIAETNLVTKNTTVKQISDYKKIINYAKLVMPNDYMSAKSSNKIEINNNKNRYLFAIIISQFPVVFDMRRKL